MKFQQFRFNTWSKVPQIMILCAVSRQSRVVGDFSIGSGSKLMSIPGDYTEKLCVVKKGIGSAEIAERFTAHRQKREAEGGGRGRFGGRGGGRGFGGGGGGRRRRDEGGLRMSFGIP